VLIFDGDCGFCTTAARWAARGWTGAERAVAWQQLDEIELRRLGITVEQARAAAWWVGSQCGSVSGHRAMGEALRAGSGWRRLAGALVLAAPMAPVAGALYDLVARHRHRLPGARTPACPSGR
jgi:predicted DCC family thiol-disulfide oxidoreductase YuxK